MWCGGWGGGWGGGGGGVKWELIDIYFRGLRWENRGFIAVLCGLVLLAGWTGLHCQDDVNECLPQPCAQGLCLQNEPGSGYTCFCRPGYVVRIATSFLRRKAVSSLSLPRGLPPFLLLSSLFLLLLCSFLLHISLLISRASSSSFPHLFFPTSCRPFIPLSLSSPPPMLICASCRLASSHLSRFLP